MKPNLLLLHGALGSHLQLEQMRKSLEDDFNVHSFDFLSHGIDQTKEAFTIESLTEQLNQIINDLERETCNIFGYSMGGYVALNASISNPKITKIMTYGTKFNWTKESSERESKMLNPDKILEKVPHFAQHLEKVHGDDWKSVLLHTADMMIALGLNPTLNANNMANIKIPVLISRGSKDRMVSLDESQDASKHMGAAKHIEIEDMPHEIQKLEVKVIKSHLSQFFI